jgi:hypothetical protein
MHNEPIATRIFTFDDGSASFLEVLLYSPIQDGGDYRCKYAIREDGQVTKEGYAVGVDGLQALVLAVQKMGADIAFSEYGKARKLYWNNQNSDLGLPLPRGV